MNKKPVCQPVFGDSSSSPDRLLKMIRKTRTNLSFQELAQRAFDAVKAAWETLSDPEKRETCENVIANAKRTLDDEIAAKRKEMRQKGRAVIIPEDDPNVYKQELHKKTVKVCRSGNFLFSQKFENANILVGVNPCG